MQVVNPGHRPLPPRFEQSLCSIRRRVSWTKKPSGSTSRPSVNLLSPNRCEKEAVFHQLNPGLDTEWEEWLYASSFCLTRTQTQNTHTHHTYTTHATPYMHTTHTTPYDTTHTHAYTTHAHTTPCTHHSHTLHTYHTHTHTHTHIHQCCFSMDIRVLV